MVANLYENHPITKLIDRANSAGIRTAVWKGSLHLDQIYAGTEDLDLLVEEGADFASIAKQSGFFEVHKPWYKSDVGLSDFITFDEVGSCLHVHVHYIIIFGGAVEREFHYPVEKEVLDRRIWNEEYSVWTVCPQDDVQLFLIRHAVRTKLGLPVDFGGEFSLMAKAYSLPMSSFGFFATLSAEGVGDTVKSLSDFNGINSVRKIVKRKMNFYGNRQPRSISTLVLVILIWFKVLQKLGFGTASSLRIASGGSIISFVGIDGSGKSSAIDRLEKVICGVIGTQKVTFGSGQSGAGVLRRSIFWLFGSKARLSSHKRVREPGASSKKKDYPLYYKVWILLCLLEKRKAIKRCLSAKAKGKIILADRWLQTERPAAVDYPRLTNMSVHSRFDRYLVSLEDDIYMAFHVMRPQLVILLDVSPKNSTLRKPDDLDLETAGKARQELLAVPWSADRVVTVNANDSIADVDRSIMIAINSSLSKLVGVSR